MKPPTVTGRISGPGVTDFSHCVILLYNTAGTARVPATKPQVSPAGRYVITHVPPGTWRAVCLPNPVTPLAAMTYHQEVGLRARNGTAIRVHKGQLVTADFHLHAAGRLQVIVTDPAGQPIPRAGVINYLPTAKVATSLPVLTDAAGAAHFYNVPLASKVAVAAPRGFRSAWWNGGHSWRSAKVVRIPAQGQPLSLTAVLARA